MERTKIEEYVFGSILLLANKIQIWGDNKLEDLTLKQWFLLILILKMDSSNPTIKEVSDFTGTSRQNTKKILEQLDEKKYVRIKKSKTDARALNVSILKKTNDFFAKNDKKGTEIVNQLFTNISDEELVNTQKLFDKLHGFFGNPTLLELIEKENKN